MKRYLEKIRKRPDHEKKKLVTTFALITTGLIITAWVVIISLGNNNQNESVNEESSTEESSFVDTINTLFNESSDNFDEIATDFNETSEFFNTETSLEAQIEAEANENNPAPSKSMDDNPETINETLNYEE